MYPNYETISAMPIFHGLALSVLLPFAIILLAWTVIIKGFALWYAGRNNQKLWFVFLLVVNTLGFIEVLYLIFWRKNNNPTVAVSSAPVA